MQILVTVCVLLSLVGSVRAHVVETNFGGCTSFFYNGFVPTGLNYGQQAHICQFYDNNYHFATLFDTSRRIPVYSAYKFEKGRDHPEIPWCVEPQLVNEDWDEKMMTVTALMTKYPRTQMSQIEAKQAVDQDYESLKELRDYNRGHLNPKGHHVGSGSKATFTLTNMVPQNKTLNNGAWATYEENLKNNIFKDCDEAFVLVGAIPSDDNWVKRGNKNRVNIPSYLWNAYCCVKRNKPIKTGAATAKNTDENKVNELDLNGLKTFLKDKLKKKNVPELFDKTCKAE